MGVREGSERGVEESVIEIGEEESGSERGEDESGIEIGEEESGSERGEEEWRKDSGWE